MDTLQSITKEILEKKIEIEKAVRRRNMLMHAFARNAPLEEKEVIIAYGPRDEESAVRKMRFLGYQDWTPFFWDKRSSRFFRMEGKRYFKDGKRHLMVVRKVRPEDYSWETVCRLIERLSKNIIKHSVP